MADRLIDSPANTITMVVSFAATAYSNMAVAYNPLLPDPLKCLHDPTGYIKTSSSRNGCVHIQSEEPHHVYFLHACLLDSGVDGLHKTMQPGTMNSSLATSRRWMASAMLLRRWTLNLGCLFLQKSSRYQFIMFMSIVLNRNHDSFSTRTLAGRPSGIRSAWCLCRKIRRKWIC